MGRKSFASGTNVVAKGQYSFVNGDNTVALGQSSHAEGSKTTASGIASHSEGTESWASNFGSHAEGNKTEATGEFSHAEGNLSKSVGDVSHAEGFNTIAAGNTSHTEGNGSQTKNERYIRPSSGGSGGGSTGGGTTEPTQPDNDMSTFFGVGAHAEGAETIASGYVAHAEGYKSYASGHMSHAEGSVTDALGDYSHVEGVGSKAKGSISHAEGLNTLSEGKSAHSEGDSTKATGEFSHVEGSNSISIGGSSHAEGLGTKSKGDFSHSEGYHTQANGNGSHSEGSLTIATGAYAHAEGDNNEAVGVSAHVEGGHNKALKDYSHAEGYLTQAQDFAHSEGYQTKALGNSSHAEGYNTIASHSYSHTSGYFTKTGRDIQFVCGGYNEGKSNTLFEVGTGSSDTDRMNALEVTDEGRVKVKREPQQPLDVLRFDELANIATYKRGRYMIDNDKFPILGTQGSVIIYFYLHDCYDGGGGIDPSNHHFYGKADYSITKKIGTTEVYSTSKVNQEVSWYSKSPYFYIGDWYVSITNLSTYSYNASITSGGGIQYTDTKSFNLNTTDLGGQVKDVFTRANPIGTMEVEGFTAGESTNLILKPERSYSGDSFPIGVNSSTPKTYLTDISVDHYWFALDWVIFEKSKFY